MDTSLASEETHLIFSSDLGIDEWCNPTSSFLGLQCLLARCHISDWYFLTGGQDHPVGDRGERDIFGNIFLGQVRGHWRDSGGGFTFPTPFVCVYAVAFAQQCMSIKCSVLINFYGSCGETDLRFGVHFANNHIIRVELVEEMENIGSLSSYVKYSIVKYYLIICAHNHLAFIEHFKCCGDCPLTYLGVIFPSH